MDTAPTRNIVPSLLVGLALGLGVAASPAAAQDAGTGSEAAEGTRGVTDRASASVGVTAEVVDFQSRGASAGAFEPLELEAASPGEGLELATALTLSSAGSFLLEGAVEGPEGAAESLEGSGLHEEGARIPVRFQADGPETEVHLSVVHY